MNNMEKVLENTIQRCRDNNIIIPTYAQMRNPELIPENIREQLGSIGLWDLNPLNLFRITWKNEPVKSGGGYGEVNHVILPKSLTGVDAKIIVLIGVLFPLFILDVQADTEYECECDDSAEISWKLTVIRQRLNMTLILISFEEKFLA